MEKQVIDDKIKELFISSRAIALVGASNNREKDSNKVMKFLQWVETNQKLPTRKPNELFSDGSKISNFWFRIKSDQKIEQPPFDLLKSNPILMLAYQKYQKSKLIIKLTPEQKVMKLLQWVETNQKPPTRSNELFSDGANISSFWYGINIV